MTKINLYNNSHFTTFIKSVNSFEKSEKGDHYKKLLCLKETSGSVQEKTIENAYDRVKHKITNSLEEILEHNKKKICVLPKNHKGKCECDPFSKIFLKNSITEKIKKKFRLSILNSPGADDYIIKNRASRLFPIVFSSADEKRIRDKKFKLKAGISLKEFTTPFCLATAYLDWMVYILNVNNIEKYLLKKSKILEAYNEAKTLQIHKRYLNNYFESKNRKNFNSKGKTICSVTREQIEIKDISDPDRDNRIDINNNDVQMGHLISRSNNEVTIRGLNLSIMSREGNRIIGEYSLFDNEWIKILDKILSPYNLSVKKKKQKID